MEHGQSTVTLTAKRRTATSGNSRVNLNVSFHMGLNALFSIVYTPVKEKSKITNAKMKKKKTQTDARAHRGGVDRAAC